MGFVMRGCRVGGYLAPSISQHELRFIRTRGLRNRKLVVEARQARSPGQNEFPAGNRGDIKISYLVETSCEQPSRRIVGQRLAFRAVRAGNEDGKAARSPKRSGRTQRHSSYSPKRKPQTLPPTTCRTRSVSFGGIPSAVTSTVERPRRAINGPGPCMRDSLAVFIRYQRGWRGPAVFDLSPRPRPAAGLRRASISSSIRNTRRPPIPSASTR